jgi:coenzyme Q-binding protein COQ10
MPRYETVRTVRHVPETMFDFVADVERYPEFVPMCEALRIRRRSETGPGASVILADMSIGYKMIRETFTTRVTLDRSTLSILVEYVDGPFRRLENRWTFLPRADGAPGSDVRFFIDYEFKSRTFQILAGAVFEKVFRRMAEAFEVRADELARRRAS